MLKEILQPRFSTINDGPNEWLLKYFEYLKTIECSYKITTRKDSRFTVL